jgi:CBS domain-containing protein
MKVEQLMSPRLTTCGFDMPLGEVAALLVGHEIHGAFVVDGDGRIVGVITDTDLLSAEWLGTSGEGVATMKGMTAGEMMTHPVAVIEAGADIHEATRRLRERRISRLLVTDHGESVGVLAIADLVAALGVATSARQCVRDVMSYGIVVCRPDTPVRRAARAMVERRSRSVGVLHADSGRLAGVLTGRDLLTALEDGVDDLAAHDVMTAPALTTTADASLSEAADLMLAHEVHRLFVVDGADEGLPLGLVSTADIMVEMASPGSVWRTPPPRG